MDAILVVLIVGVVLLGPLALIGWACWRAFRDRSRRFELSTTLPGPSADPAARLAETMTSVLGRWGYRLKSQSVDSVVFSRRYRPAWLVLPCVLLFPFGLLALAYARTVDVSFSLFVGDGGSEVIVSGLAPSRLGDEIEEGLEEQRAAAGRRL